jgi:citrate/tricarballylate utilization protein
MSTPEFARLLETEANRHATEANRHATEALTEADRLMTVCNSCRYCEGLCAVFPAMEMRRSFESGDLNYLANLCHACGACHVDCQFSPPHEFNVNVPQTLAKVRQDSYRLYAWPRALAPLFDRNGLAVSLVLAASVGLFVLGLMAINAPDEMFGNRAGPGGFYRLLPHNAMAAIFGLAFLYALIAMRMGVRQFWRDAAARPLPGATIGPAAFRQALRDAMSLRYLDGGGVGCIDDGERPDDRRRVFHHLTAYGFGLCFAATVVATFYHYAIGRPAPYAWYDLPVVLGTLGGIGLIVGAAGLLWAKSRRDPSLASGSTRGMDSTFTVMLLLVSLSGVLLLFLRDTAAMGTLLALHLGFVLGFFVTMPYGKFVHGIYRFAALVRYAGERTAPAARS